MKASLKLFKKRFCPRISMGLKENHETFLRPGLGDCSQGGPDFGWMMTIIVNYGNPINLSFLLHPSLYAAITLQSFLYSGKRQLQL